MIRSKTKISVSRFSNWKRRATGATRVCVRNVADLNSNIGKRNYQREMEKSAIASRPSPWMIQREYKKLNMLWGSDGRRRLYLINKVAAKECTLVGRVDSSSLSVISTTRAATSSQPGRRLSTSAVELGNDYRKRRQRRRMSYWRSLNSHRETRDQIQYRAQYYR